MTRQPPDLYNATGFTDQKWLRTYIHDTAFLSSTARRPHLTHGIVPPGTPDCTTLHGVLLYSQGDDPTGSGRLAPPGVFSSGPDGPPEGAVPQGRRSTPPLGRRPSSPRPSECGDARRLGAPPGPRRCVQARSPGPSARSATTRCRPAAAWRNPDLGGSRSPGRAPSPTGSCLRGGRRRRPDPPAS